MREGGRCIFVHMLHWGLWAWDSGNKSSFNVLFSFHDFDTVFCLKHEDIRKECVQFSSPFMLLPASSPPPRPQRVSSSRNPELTQQEGQNGLKVQLPLFITEHPFFFSYPFFSLKDKDREESWSSSLICSSWWPIHLLKSPVIAH